MPVPVPRQRSVPAAESGQARPQPAPGAPETATAPADGGAPAQTDADAPADASTSAPARSALPGHIVCAPGARQDHFRTPDGGRTGEAPSVPVGVAASCGTGALTLLVIEDDPARSLNVPEMLDAAGNPIKVRTARNLTEAERLLTDDVHCILLDLALHPSGCSSASTAAGTPQDTPSGSTASHGTAAGSTAADSSATGDRGAAGAAPSPIGSRKWTAALPPADELATLKDVLRLAPRHAVLALTACGDAESGAEAVRVGAQDYLQRGELDGRLLSRAIRYAVERKRADVAQRQLTESRLRAQENARLERGLLPTPLLEGSVLRFAARYRPGRSRALLGGDFYDTVRTPDGTVHAMIGDVCGHGPDEAALGVELRIAWRALTLAGLSGDALLSTLQQVLEHERADEEIFASLCTMDIAPDGRRAGLCLAGHPAPLLVPHGGLAGLLPCDDNGPALGMLPGTSWPRHEVELPEFWSLLLYTDGLIEGRVGDGTQRLGQDGMVDLVRRKITTGLRGDALLGATLDEACALSGGDLADDVAMLLLDREP